MQTATSFTKDKAQVAIIENYLCIKMPKEVDHDSIAKLREQADEMILQNAVQNIVFDFEETEFMDSSGIGIIVGRYRKISCLGGKVFAINANARIKKILRTSGMQTIIDVLS